MKFAPTSLLAASAVMTLLVAGCGNDADTTPVTEQSTPSIESTQLADIVHPDALHPGMDLDVHPLPKSSKSQDVDCFATPAPLPAVPGDAKLEPETLRYEPGKGQPSWDTLENRYPAECADEVKKRLMEIAASALPADL